MVVRRAPRWGLACAHCERKSERVLGLAMIIFRDDPLRQVDPSLRDNEGCPLRRNNIGWNLMLWYRSHSIRRMSQSSMTALACHAEVQTTPDEVGWPQQPRTQSAALQLMECVVTADPSKPRTLMCAPQCVCFSST